MLHVHNDAQPPCSCTTDTLAEPQVHCLPLLLPAFRQLGTLQRLGQAPVKRGHSLPVLVALGSRTQLRDNTPVPPPWDTVQHRRILELVNGPSWYSFNILFYRLPNLRVDRALSGLFATSTKYLSLPCYQLPTLIRTQVARFCRGCRI
jgi:hypothetical protein